jgi:hypothetical protein
MNGPMATDHTKVIPRIMRGLILVLLGMLTFVLGARLYRDWGGPGPRSDAVVKCAACPFAQRCGGRETNLDGRKR